MKGTVGFKKLPAVLQVRFLRLAVVVSRIPKAVHALPGESRLQMLLPSPLLWVKDMTRPKCVCVC